MYECEQCNRFSDIIEAQKEIINRLEGEIKERIEGKNGWLEYKHQLQMKVIKLNNRIDELEKAQL